MSQMLNFISSFGSSAELRSLPVAELTARMQAFGLNAAEIQVLLSGDRHAVAEMMKTSGDIVCCVVPEKPVQPGKPDDPAGPAQDDDDDEEEKKASLRHAV